MWSCVCLRGDDCVLKLNTEDCEYTLWCQLWVPQALRRTDPARWNVNWTRNTLLYAFRNRSTQQFSPQLLRRWHTALEDHLWLWRQGCPWRLPCLEVVQLCTVWPQWRSSAGTPLQHPAVNRSAWCWGLSAYAKCWLRCVGEQVRYWREQRVVLSCGHFSFVINTLTQEKGDKS